MSSSRRSSSWTNNLGRQTNPAGIHEAGGQEVVLPIFGVRFEPMNRLMLADSDDDPVGHGIELQTFEAVDGGESALELLWRRDGFVEVHMPRFPARLLGRRRVPSAQPFLPLLEDVRERQEADAMQAGTGPTASTARPDGWSTGHRS